MLAVGLSLSGVVHFGVSLTGLGARHAGRGLRGDFMVGVLACVVASPCTAPFMGAALGYAISQSVAVTLAVFIALGAGMAVPYVLLAWFPGWRKRLPRPGRWMERVKQFLAFPLYATVAWLAWVLGAQVDNDAVFRLALALVFTAIAGWAWRVFRSGGARAWAGVALAGAASMAFVVAPLFATSAASAQARAAKADIAADWRAFSPATVASLQAGGQPVFVDFTAAWCVTCQVNKRLVLNDVEVRTAFAKKNVALVRADWTRRDPQITQALAALGRNGVPVYVLYRPGKEPLLLPEVLKASLVHDALATL
jgi:thiol:disulfide interchange protein DsbD